MKKKISSAHPLRFQTRRLSAWLAGPLLLTGCALDTAPEASGEHAGTKEQHLIGGRQAAPYHLRSTVGIGDACTAATVGPRLFLTAAHCVDVPRPRRMQPVPPDYPANDGVHEDYLPGKSLLIHWGLTADDADQAEFTIVKTTIHPSWWECEFCDPPHRSPGSAADIAVIEIAEDTPDIRQARVDLDPVAVGEQVVKVGWGCEERTNIDPSTLELIRYKSDDAWVIPTNEIQHDGTYFSSALLNDIGGGYLITAGHAQDPGLASLCLGDSGGPLYIPDNTDPRVVGVNSDYTFKPSGDPEDLGGVSWTDWHTKVSTDSIHGVAQWLIGLNVDTVGGSLPTSECTCPSGCDAIKSVSVPVTKQGVDDSCYFLPDLGYSINNHSMVNVNLNGQNITNSWVGNWAYPAKKDGGYYLYVKGQLGWSWWQATN